MNDHSIFPISEQMGDSCSANYNLDSISYSIMNNFGSLFKDWLSFLY